MACSTAPGKRSRKNFPIPLGYQHHQWRGGRVLAFLCSPRVLVQSPLPLYVLTGRNRCPCSPPVSALRQRSPAVRLRGSASGVPSWRYSVRQPDGSRDS